MSVNINVEGVQAEEKMTVEMSQETVLAFISHVEGERCLWDRSHPEYKNRNKQQDAWECIGHQLQVPVPLLREKWSSLHGSYRHYKKIHDNSLVTGSGSIDECRPRWFAFSAMAFLHAITDGGSRVDTFEANTLPPDETTREAISSSSEPDEFDNLEYNLEEANLQYNEEVLAALGNIAKARQELRSAGSENCLTPLYANMRDWSPIRKEAMVIRIQSMIMEEHVARFVEKHGYDPRN